VIYWQIPDHYYTSCC